MEQPANRGLIGIAMAGAGLMLAHHVAAKAFRDATFLTAWSAAALPAVTVVTALLSVALVPLVTRLFERYSPLPVVSFGLAMSAAGHVLEWTFYDFGRWTAVAIYLHVGVISVVLLSGFWSLVAERVDPAGARRAYGRIAAAGTIGGIAGTLAAERLAVAAGPAYVLALLSGLHLICAGAVALMQRTPVLLPRSVGGDEPDASIRTVFCAPYVRAIAWFVVLTGASTAILDFLLKAQATAAFGTGPDLLRFFALFYGTVQVLSFVAQTQSGNLLHRFGLNRLLTALPVGVGAAGTLSLVVPGWPTLTALRGIDAVLRGSVFRSAYELLFVPMDVRTRNRAKAVLDVICDRVGEAAGSGIVHIALVVVAAAWTPHILLAAVIALAVAAWGIGQRFGRLYLDVIERELVKRDNRPRVSVVSEAGWTLLDVPPVEAPRGAPAEPVAAPRATAPPSDPVLQALADLRSTDVARVLAALSRPASLGRIHAPHIIDLLAWDEVLPAARAALEHLAAAHVGMLVDALLDPRTDFVLRRRLPRVLGTVAADRSIAGLVEGLSDSRFEVRYHCGRAIDRILTTLPSVAVDRAKIIAAIERELSVPPQRWHGYRLLDRPDLDEQTSLLTPAEGSSRFLEYVLLLLATIVAREPLDAAVHGIRSTNAGVRGLAIEYLDHVLPPLVLERVRGLFATEQRVPSHQ